MGAIDRRAVSVCDINGRLLYTRLWDYGAGPLLFEGGFGFVDRLDVKRFHWQITGGWVPLKDGALVVDDASVSRPAPAR